ncbi:uncharacterized protein LOC129909390, partial [Episyrphus balteatus]|uniref:uncharacterized protein LOC129909390 n=1 Tax=Episyrphus balteatus TaxID=286459 RepID=UPI002486A4DA
SCLSSLQIFLILGYLSLSSSLPTNDAKKLPKFEDSSLQSKRDLSLSYSATDIGSKDGSRAKTITVIKNVAGKKEEALKIDPKLHKHENWGSEFRDNFDSYGIIPDVPDIDDLFEFVNKKKEEKKPKEKDSPEAKEPKGKDKKPNKGKEEPPKETKKEEPTPSPPPVEEVTEEVKDEKVEKIAGDAELLMPPGKQGKVKSQSLDMGRYSVRENFNDDNYAAPQHSGQQQFSQTEKKSEKFILPPAGPYNYPEPSLKGYVPPNGNPAQPQAQADVPRGSIIVTTPSGKSFDSPIENSTSNTPYLAPNFRRNQNSVPNQQFPSSSQRPYVAPNVRKPYEVTINNSSPPPDCAQPPGVFNNRAPITFNGYRNVVPNIRPDVFRGYRPRSRGLRFY